MLFFFCDLLDELPGGALRLPVGRPFLTDFCLKSSTPHLRESLEGRPLGRLGIGMGEKMPCTQLAEASMSAVLQNCMLYDSCVYVLYTRMSNLYTSGCMHVHTSSSHTYVCMYVWAGACMHVLMHTCVYAGDGCE